MPASSGKRRIELFEPKLAPISSSIPVTTPSTVTFCPAMGDPAPGPWTVWILVISGSGSPPPPARFCGLPAFGPAKSAELSPVSCRPPSLRSKELSPLAAGVVMPVPSRQGLAGEPTPSMTAPEASTRRAPLWLVPAAKSVKPVEYAWSPGTAPE